MKKLKAIFAACAGGAAMTGCASLPDAPAFRQQTAVIGTHAPEAIRSTAHEYALLATHPYAEGSTPWKQVATSEDLMGRSRSGFDGALFQSGEKYAFVFYGYNSRKDFGDVVKVGFLGVPRRQLREAEAFTHKSAETYGFDAAEAQVIGHSMGGYLAKAVGIHEGVPEVWAFNSPGFKTRDPQRIEKVLGEPATGEVPHIYNFNSRQDVVGLWGHQPGQVYEVDTPRRHHTMQEMATALRPAGETAPEVVVEPEKKGVMQRVFNRIVNSKIVQKALHNRFRSAGPAVP